MTVLDMKQSLQGLDDEAPIKFVASSCTGMFVEQELYLDTTSITTVNKKNPQVEIRFNTRK